MKYTITIIALLSALNFFGQNKIAQKVAGLVENQTEFKRFSPLTASLSPKNAGEIEKVVSNAVYATANTTVINEIAAQKFEALELEIPYNGQSISVQLYKVDISAEGFHIDTDKSTSVKYDEGTHYRGIIKGDNASLVSFNFFKNEVNGIISGAQYNNIVVGKLHKKGNVSDYIIYSDVNLKVLQNFTCATPDPEHLPERTILKNNQDILTTRCVTMYFELDYDIYLENFSDMDTTVNWITSVFNNIQTLFANDGIATAMKSVYIWTEQDPYSGTSSEEFLMGFFENRPVFDGDLGQLLTIENAGLGGLAALDGLCDDFNYSYVDLELNFEEVPAFSWTIEATTHEIGHLMGSPHTHACYWNGNDTPIDGCGIRAGYDEGCESDVIPWQQRGTIMSYCHLLQEVGINFANGFGPQPAQLIIANVNSSRCLATSCVSDCDNLATNLIISNTSSTTATIRWTDNINNGPWEVAAAPFNSTFTNWQTATATNFTFNGLNPNAYYKFAVRPVCEGDSATPIQITSATAGDYCSGLAFTDTGGANSHYGDSQNIVRTITPDANADISVVFTQFSLEDGYDFMYVYNGATVNAPLLGRYTGNSIPGPFVSTASDGSLTFLFTSDDSVTSSGWNATISCANLSTADNAFSNFSYYPNPSNGLVSIKASEEIKNIMVYNVAGQLLLTKESNGTETAVDITPFANGVYFFRAVSGDKETNFRIIKQ